MNPDNFIKTLENSKNILVLSSQPLDLDSISSGLLVKKYLQSLNYSVDYIFTKEIGKSEKERNEWLPYSNEVIYQDSRGHLNNEKYDTYIFLDGAGLHQFYDNSSEEPVPTINLERKLSIIIDHHQDVEADFYNLKIKDVQASSTVELLLQQVIPLNFMGEQLATLAYAAIIGDTGGFKWNFRPQTLRLCADLLEKGANTKSINNNMFLSTDLDSLKAQAYAIKHTEFIPRLQTSFLVMDNQTLINDLKEYKDLSKLRDAFNNQVSIKAKGYNRGFMIYEKHPGSVTVSSRGKDGENNLNLSELLNKYGSGTGGGHFNSAGLRVESTVGEVKNRILEHLELLISNDIMA